jgi:hypothetical protein
MSLLRFQKTEDKNPPDPRRLPHRWAIIIGFAGVCGIALSLTIGAAVGVPAAIGLAVFLNAALE